MRFRISYYAGKSKSLATTMLLSTAVAMAMSASAAAQCTAYPTPLANGNPADATQVMGDLNYLAGCLAPSANPHLSGNVGIGTTSPLQALDVNGVSKSTYLELGPDGAFQGFNIYYNSGWTYRTSDYGYVIRHSGAHLDFYTFPVGSAGSLASSSSTPLSMNGANVGIGTTSPSQTLQVTGTALVTPAAGWGESNTAYVYTGDTNNGLSATYGVNVNVFGYNGVNISSASGTNMMVNGGGAYAAAFTTWSDKRLKKDIVSIDGALAMIERLRGVRFNWRAVDERTVGKDLKLPTSDPQVGFIAQELKAVLPEAVTTAEGHEAIMSVQESKVVPVLVEATKQLVAQIAQLKATDAAAISQLKASNHRYADQVRQLKASNEQSEARLRKIEAFIAALGRKNIMQVFNAAPDSGG